MALAPGVTIESVSRRGTRPIGQEQGGSWASAFDSRRRSQAARRRKKKKKLGRPTKKPLTIEGLV